MIRKINLGHEAFSLICVPAAFYFQKARKMATEFVDTNHYFPVCQSCVRIINV